MSEACVMIGATLPWGKYTLEGIKPGKQSFDLPSPPVSAQRPAVLCDRSFSIALVWGDPFNAFGSKSLIERITIVGAIPNNSFGSSHVTISSRVCEIYGRISSYDATMAPDRGREDLKLRTSRICVVRISHGSNS
nr:hypothetical protein [Herbaspirillum sp. B65]